MKRQQATSSTRALALMLVVLVGLLVGLPVLLLLITLSPGDSAAWVERHRLLLDGGLQQSWLYTLTVALAACVIASLVAIPAAFVAVRGDPLIRRTLITFGILPLAMPAFATAGLARDYFGGDGITAWAAMLPGPISPQDIMLTLVYAWHFLPLILLSLIAGLSRIDRKLSESAANLGASGFLILRRITLPLVTPSFILGAGLMMLKIIEDVGTPLILGVDHMLAPQILLQLSETSLADHLLANQLLLLLLMAVLITVFAWPALLPNGDNAEPADTCRWPRHPLTFTLAFGLTVSVSALVIAPYAWLLNKVRDANIDWPTLASSFGPEISLNGTLIAALGSGTMLALLGGLAITSMHQHGWQNRLARFTVAAIFALPGVMLAIAYQNLQTWIGDVAVFAWIALVFTVALKHLSLVPHLFANRPVGKPADLAYKLGWIAYTARLWLPAHAATIFGLLILGFTAMLLELSAALVLITQAPPPLAMALFQELQSPGGPIAGTTLTLWLVVAILIGLGGTLASLRPSAQPRTHQTKKRATDKPAAAENPS